MIADLERLGARTSSHTRLFGAFLATHAIPDALCFLHSGEGCKTKTQHHLVFHDWFRESHNRRIWTGLTDTELVSGSARRLEEMVRTWASKRKADLVLVLTPAFVEAAGEDLDTPLRALAAELGCPVRGLSAAGYSGDLFDGYQAALMAAFQTVDWSRPAEGGINIVGHFFDRYEADRQADVDQLRLLAAAIGLKVRAIFLSGCPLAQLQEGWRAQLNVVLPYAAGRAAEIAALSGRPTVVTDLPLGTAGTAAWLRRLATAAELPEAPVANFIDQQLGRTVPVLNHLVGRLGEADAPRRCAIFADTPLAAALAAFLADLQLVPTIVGLNDVSLGGRAAFAAAWGRLAPAGAAEPPVIIEHPTRRQTVRLLTSAGESRPELLLGSSVELGDLQELALPGIEVGFPSFFRHGLAAVPMLGFDGALHLAQRLMQALSKVY